MPKTHEDYLSVANDRLLFKNNKDMGAIFKGDDGYYHWWPDALNGGSIPAYFLRFLADLLDEMNKPWDDEITAYFTAAQARLDAEALDREAES